MTPESCFIRLDQALALVEAEARELDCGRELDHLAMILAVGGGAGRQRDVYEIAGMEALLRDLTQLTSSTTTAEPQSVDSLRG